VLAPFDRQLQPLTPEECFAYLAGTSVGRVAYSRQALPTLSPVVFDLRDGSIVVSTMNARAVHDFIGTVVAFAADHLDEDAPVMWHVAVTGMAYPLPASGAGQASARGATTGGTRHAGLDGDLVLRGEPASRAQARIEPGVVTGWTLR
jgi:nitroimidazol reductase NimA-like FMN-containing flavoprotein (pyridoxamine 5'-phosphate oxidase superfamily)